MWLIHYEWDVKILRNSWMYLTQADYVRVLHTFLQEWELAFNVLPTIVKDVNRELITGQSGNALFQNRESSLWWDQKAAVVKFSYHLSSIQAGIHFGDDRKEVVHIPAIRLE